MFRVAFNTLAKSTTARQMSTQSAIGKVSANIEGFKKFLGSESTKKAVRAALVELRPPTPAELPRAFADGFRLFTKGNWRNITVREAWLNTLVTTEVVCWFFVGEVIGKGTLVGYQV